MAADGINSRTRRQLWKNPGRVRYTGERNGYHNLNAFWVRRTAEGLLVAYRSVMAAL